MKLQALKTFMTELSRLRSLYITCEYSLESTRIQLRRELRHGNLTAESIIRSLTHNEVVATNPYAIANRMESQFPKCLRETIFVRLISALEVFIVETIRETFAVRPELFHTDAKLEISHREVLSLRSLAELRTKILNRETRRLQSGGLTEMEKYMRRRFGVKFSTLVPSLKQFRELHDRRHILVHRLGRADEFYRRTYDYRKKAALSVSRDYLFEAFEVASTFTTGLHDSIVAVISETEPHHTLKGDHFALELLVRPLSHEGLAITRSSFHFSVNDREVGDRVVSLRDILAVSQNEGNGVRMVLSGRAEDVRRYLQMVRRHERKGHLDLLRKETIRQPSSMREVKACTLHRELVEQIARALPPRPWSKGTHKVVAAHFGISNTQCTSAITLILQDSELSSLIGTEPLEVETGD